MSNNILWAIEEQHITMTVILDLSAAFDIVDHYILFKILESQFRVTDTALKWFDSYLRPRSFKVCIGDEYSESQQLSFSVPQGSSSWANILISYCALINKLVPDLVSINSFADDHSLWKTFKARNIWQETTIKQLLKDTFNSIKDWRDKMQFKLNSDKTEYILFGPKQQLNNAAHEPFKAGPETEQCQISGRTSTQHPQLWITHIP